MKEELFAELADIVEQECARRGADTVEILVICEAVFDQLFKKHQDKRQDVIGNDDMKEVNTLLYMLTGDPEDLLPFELQGELLHPEAFRKAIEKNLLAVEKGRVVSKFKKKVLLAYLLGRLFSGDYSYPLRGDMVWGQGDENFPSAELKKYFDVENLRQLRQNRLGYNVPKGYQIVDNLFV